MAERNYGDLISKTPGVCGGVACLAGMRMPVWTLARWRQLGFKDAGILVMYPQLSQRQLDAAWQYVRAYAQEIKRDINENELSRLRGEHD